MKKRIIALLLTFVLTLALVGCGTKMEEGTIKEGLCYEITGISPDTIVAVVEGVEIPMDYYFYWLNFGASYMQNFMSYYGMEFDWDFVVTEDKTVLDFVKEDSMNTVGFFALLEKMMHQGTLTLDEEMLAALETQRSAAVEQYGGEEAYLAGIASIGVREETYDRICRDEFLYEAFYELYEAEDSRFHPSQEQLMAFALTEGYQTADHILLATVDSTTREPLDAETVARKKAQAEELLTQLSATSAEEREAVFSSLADQYSEDPGRAAAPTGYTFGPNEMVQEFEEAAAALVPGELSGIVESDFGYHIILKKELSEEAAELVLDAYFSILRSELLAAAKVERSSVLDELDIPKVYEEFLAAQLATEESSDTLTEPSDSAADSAEPASP